MSEEKNIKRKTVKGDDLVKAKGPHMNVLDVEFKPVPSLPMNEIIVPMRLKHGCYQELTFLGKTFELQLN